jgi:hypothetical protein
VITFDPNELPDAMDRIGATGDGRIMLAYLHSIMLSGIPAGQNSGAVHEGVGRLNLARELINMMDTGKNNASCERDRLDRPRNLGQSDRRSRRRVQPDPECADR